ncbi:thioredoxin TrxC [Marinobacterium sp. D7]|uniref:thioredoxin TrxC n=1 Tax=Marinobacterium ramblicola TaxID=2849041 RepID=UPI001C2DA384|nr:thioredoxin TrxC [Marinobacterium ramblicola]MBV1786503.1 thioredoxin TrxC [Marinobacterium ramblicola]
MTSVVTLSCPSCLVTNRVARDRLGATPKCGRCGQLLFQGVPLVLDQAGFERVLANTELPLVVDFWAQWCGPCRMMAPVFERAAAALEPDFRLVKVDTEAAPALAQRYQIRSIPTLILFAGGREMARHSGAMDLGSLERWVRSQL